MLRSYLGALAAILVYTIGARFGLGWGFLAGVCELAGLFTIELAADEARRLQGR